MGTWEKLKVFFDDNFGVAFTNVMTPLDTCQAQEAESAGNVNISSGSESRRAPACILAGSDRTGVSAMGAVHSAKCKQTFPGPAHGVSRGRCPKRSITSGPHSTQLAWFAMTVAPDAVDAHPETSTDSGLAVPSSLTTYR